MVIKETIFHLKRHNFLVLYDSPQADSLGQSKIPWKSSLSRDIHCPSLIAIEYIVKMCS